MKIQFRSIGSEGLEEAYALMQQLREHISFEDFIFIHQKANHANQYTLTGAYFDGDLVGLMGFRILYDLVHGKHLYIDDLVVAPMYRGLGIGAQMLTYAEAIAGKLICNGVRLSTGTANEEGIKFYGREGWQLKAYTFKKGF